MLLETLSNAVNALDSTCSPSLLVVTTEVGEKAVGVECVKSAFDHRYQKLGVAVGGDGHDAS
jgi:hypothetical protein